MSANLHLRRLLPWLFVCLCGSFYSGAVKTVDSRESIVDSQRTGDKGNDYLLPASHYRLSTVDHRLTDRPLLRRIYTAEIGVREATGKNDGPRIREYLRYVGLGEGYAWCAAFVCWSLGEAGIGNPKNGWSPALFPARRTVWSRQSAVISRQSPAGRTNRSQLTTPDDPLTTSGNPGQQSNSGPQPGDIFGIYYSDLKRIAHCGFVDNWDGTWCITVEGNTGPDNAITAQDDPANPIRAGPAEGVYRKRRLVRTLYSVANWID